MERIFYTEFNQMMQALKAQNGVISLFKVPVPQLTSGVEKRERVLLSNIDVEYYNKLNETEAAVWSPADGQLKRRKYDHLGEPIRNKDGSLKFEQISIPHDSIAIISDVKIGLKSNFKPKENFMYVDYVSQKMPDNTTMCKWIYIIPRKYCFRVNQTALILATNKRKSTYGGVEVALRNGNRIFLQIIPYKPTHSSAHDGYRILCTKPSLNFDEDVTRIRKYWINNKIMFDPADCVMLEGIGGVENLAFKSLDITLDDYIRVDRDVPFGSTSQGFYDDEVILEDE